MVLGLLPASALAAAATVVVEPQEVFEFVYNFDKNDTAVAYDQSQNAYAITVEGNTLVKTPVTEDEIYAMDYADTWLLYTGDNNKNGYKTGSGEIVLPAMYEDMETDFVNDDRPYLAVSLDDVPVLVDRQGNVVFSGYDEIGYTQFDSNSGGYFVNIAKDDLWGMVDCQTLEVVVPPSQGRPCFNVDALSDGTPVFWYFVDGDATMVPGNGDASITLENVENWQCDMFAGKTYSLQENNDGECFIILEDGSYAIAPGTYSYMEDKGDGIIFCSTGMWDDGSLLTVDGTDILNGRQMSRSNIGFFADGLARFGDFGGTNAIGFINAKGEMVVEAKYTDASYAFVNGYAMVKDDAGCYLIDTTGAVVNTIPADNGNIYPIEGSNCLAANYSDADYNYITKYFNYSAPTVELPLKGDVNYFSNGYSNFYTPDGAVCVVDEDLNVVIPAGTYTDIGSPRAANAFCSDYIWVSKDVGGGEIKWGVVRLDEDAAPVVPETTQPTATPTSYPVLVNGQPVAFDVYAMKDAKGNDTNYFKLRDMASVLNGTSCQFNVGWDGAVNLTLGEAYVPNGTEMSAPFTGPQTVNDADAKTNVNGAATPLDTITLTDANGNGYTYYQLRALGDAVGFTVDWSADAGIMINTK